MTSPLFHPPSRNPRLDFLKLLLIAAVVAGHVIERYSLGQGQIIYRWIYLIHMPAFIFLSGMLSSELLDPQRGRRLFAVVVLPLLVHHAVLKGLDAWLFERPFVLNPGVPYWALWYLMSLLTWRLLLPLVCGSGFPLILAVAASLVAGCFQDFGYAWSLSRTFVFLPFFVAGHLYATRHGRQLAAPTPRSIALAAGLLLSLLGIALLTRDVPIHWLYASFAYEVFADSQWKGAALRALQLAAGAAGILAIIRLAFSVPWLARHGQYSMCVFISHIYLLKTAEARHWFDLLPQHGFPTRIAMVVLCVLACTLVGVLLGRLLPQAFDFSWIYRLGRHPRPAATA